MKTKQKQLRAVLSIMHIAGRIVDISSCGKQQAHHASLIS
jgi:hypothetical protein